MYKVVTAYEKRGGGRGGGCSWISRSSSAMINRTRSCELTQVRINDMSLDRNIVVSSEKGKKKLSPGEGLAHRQARCKIHRHLPVRTPCTLELVDLFYSDGDRVVLSGVMTFANTACQPRTNRLSRDGVDLKRIGISKELFRPVCLPIKSLVKWRMKTHIFVHKIGIDISKN